MELNVVWFLLIILLLVGYALLDGINLGIGAGFLSYKKEEEKQSLLGAIGPFWNGNEVWLLTGGGALFAAFPNAYASIFSGLYLALMLLLVGIIFRGVSIEFRNKENTEKWHSRWDCALSISSIIILFVLGVAVGNFIQGLPIDEAGNININLFALFTPFTLVVGLQSVFFFAMHGNIFAAMKSTGDVQLETIKKVKLFGSFALGLFVVSFFVWGNYSGIGIADIIFSFIAFLAIFILIGKKKCGISLILSALIAICYISSIAYFVFPNFVVSTLDPANSLNIYNSASSAKTLEIMLIIAGIGVPIMLGYTIFVYRVFKGKTQPNSEEMY